MSIEPGKTLLHYRIVEKIGEGGMGVVWKALDTDLDREVAIKLLPDGFAGEGERAARFEREAKLLATLNHPNIAAVYGLHQAGGHRFIAMEFVPGEDLAQRLERGALAVEDALDVARQIADALEAAHEQGVIHRDLKPANVKMTPDGKVKVLDLGLAKALAIDAASDPGAVSLSPTVTSAGTVAGTLLGTAGYMSPEQAKGRPVDRRADIWAFGVVLYEMLTGAKLFSAETISETLAAVLRDELSLAALPTGTPPAVGTLLQRCLDRDPRTRLRDIGEARVALAPETLSRAGAPAASTVATPVAKPSKLPWILAAAFAVLATFAFWRGAAAPDAPTESLRLLAPIDDEMLPPDDQMGILAVSPDGRNLAAVLDDGSEKALYVRRLSGGGFTRLAGTEKASTPFFSPDGEWIGFFDGSVLKKVPVSGGTPITLCEADGANRGASWGTDDMIVMSPHYTQPLMRVPASGGEPTALTTIEEDRKERTHRWPQAVPGEDLILFTVGTLDSPENYDGARIDAIRPSGGERRTILERASLARYVPSGHLVFGREGFLFAVPFDVKSLEVRGTPVPVLERVMGMRSSGVVHMDFSQNGLMAFYEGSTKARESRLVRVDRSGSRTPLPYPVAGYENLRLSPDRTKLAVQIEGDSTFDIWTIDLEQQSRTRLTFQGDNLYPSWSPDGRTIAFSSVRNDMLMSAYIKSVDGSGEARQVTAPKDSFGTFAPTGWTPDGRTLLITYSNTNGNNLGDVPVDGGEMRTLLETPLNEMYGTVSPNGKWLAYASSETGAQQIFLRTYPDAGGKWQVSKDGGWLPRWSPDGSELFFRQGNDLYAARVGDIGGTPRIGEPVVLLDSMRTERGLDYDFDMLDAESFLVIEPAESDNPVPGVTILTGWLDELERQVPNR